MTIIQLEYLLAVANCGSFSLAAEHCFVTQPSLSMQVKALEEELGVVLLDRSKKPVIPTEAGEVVLDRARETLRAYNNIRESVAELKGETSGKLRLGVIPTIAPYLLHKFIPDFVRDYPKVELEISEMVTSDIVEALKRDRIDAALVASGTCGDGILEQELFNDRFFAYVSPENPLYERQNIRIEDIDLKDLVILSAGNCMRDQIIGDKAKAYEQGAMEERQENRSRAMQELGDMFDREVAETDGGRDFYLANPGGTEENVKSAPKTIQSSAAAYRDLNATLGNFYEQPKNDNAEMDELLERIASLESELESEKGKASAMDDQVALMEKSYELAAKYMGGQNGTQPPVGQATEPCLVQKAGKNTAAPVRQVTHQVVSSLSQPMSNAEFVASFSQERNRSFNTAVGVTTVSDKNTISACVYGAQSVTDGQAVKLRLLEPMEVADKIIPRNAVVVGTAKIQGERLDIGITSLEYDGTIIPVELAVYDTDGQPGIFIPNSMEMNAVREVAANMGGSLGSSINISTNAGAQLASDLGKGLIQGTSQYIAKKMRTVKVHLKAGYKVMLYQDRN